jgi:hypothetical protein
LFEFDRGSDRADFFLAEPYPICGSGVHVVTNRNVSLRGGAYPAAGDMMDWASQLAGYDAGLAHYYSRCDRGPQYAQLSYPALLFEARRKGMAALNSETAVPRLRSPMAASMNLYAFRAGIRTDLVAYLTVDAGGLHTAPDRAPVTYALRIIFAAGDPVRENVDRRDTVITFNRAERLPPGSTIGMAVPLGMERSSNARVTLSVLNGYDSDQGQVLATSRDLPTFSSSAMDISDVVIAESREGSWMRGSARLAPAPGHALAQGSRFRMYYEIYNVEPKDALNVSVVITPGRDESLLARLQSLVSERNALSVQFAEEPAADPDGVVRSDREIGADLQPGSYVVHVTVRSERTGATVDRQTSLIIVER